MTRTLAIILFTCACLNVQAQVNIITTICGDGTASYGGDNNNATNAALNVPWGLCIDKFDNIYIADAFNHRIRKIALSTNIITTVTGTGISGYNGDNIPATNAQIDIPQATCTDRDGNVYIADGNNNRIRKITISTGIITTFAGSGPPGIGIGSSGDGGPATIARIDGPSGMCFDRIGNMYIADYGNNKIRKVDAVTGIITTCAGKGMTGYTGGNVGYSGDGGPATNAVFSGPIGVFTDSTDNIFICDQWNNVVRKVDRVTGIISTIAGIGTAGYSGDNGVATNAQLNQPCGIYIDRQNNLLIADYRNGSVRKINAVTNIITTIAGTGVAGYSGDNGPATNAQLKCANIFLDRHGELLIADVDNNRIRWVHDTTQHYTEVHNLAKSNNIKVYPNPAHDEVTIEHGKGNNISIQNVLGQQVYWDSEISDKEVLNIQDLVLGTYIVRVIGKDGSVQQARIVKY